MTMRRFPRLPSIGVLLLVTGLVLILPMLAVGRSQWSESRSRVEASEDVARSVERLAVLLRLAPALSAEQISTTWERAAGDTLVQLPPGALQLVGLNFAASLADDRALVEGLLVRLGDQEIEAAIGVAREDIDAGEVGVVELVARYGELILDIGAEVDRELQVLTASAILAGDSRVARAAEVARAAASVQVVVAGQEIRWAQLTAKALFPPTPASVEAFTNRVTLYHERSANLESAVVPGSLIEDGWVAFRDDPATEDLLAVYEATVDELAVAGIPQTVTDGTGLDPASVDFAAFLGLAAEVTRVLSMSREVAAGLVAVVEASLDEVDAASVAVVADANGARNRTLSWIVGSTILVLCALGGVVVFIARPVRRMAQTAEALGKGHAADPLPESGPREIRIGARALNEAVASLQTAEAQAIALAEERLDDPVLEQSAPGELGASLQAAVTRLTGSLNERDGFQRQLAHEATHDDLTKLPNRSAVLGHLESALARVHRNSGCLALLFIDVDEFKAINDTHGHQAGDHLLRAIAERVVTTIRAGDLAGRLGGDEFVVVAESVRDIGEASLLGRRLLDAIGAPTNFEGTTLTPSVSMGIALADGDLTADELLRDADLAVYQAKSLGKGRLEVCDERLRSELRVRIGIEHALQLGLGNDELVLHFQPVIDAKSREITSLEALVRWERPGAGLVGPDEFIPVAERSDLILDVDRWVLAEAAAHLARWTDCPTMGSLPLAVNISGRHLGSGVLCREVLEALAGEGVEPDRLVLEITETSLLEDVETAAGQLTSLREAGVRIALDDFGTGYMSLAHLRLLPVDVLKIDRSFVAAMESEAEQSLIQLIVDTGHLLGVSVTAEGVETADQAAALRAMGSDYLQGYWFGYPTDAATTESTVQQLGTNRVDSAAGA